MVMSRRKGGIVPFVTRLRIAITIAVCASALAASPARAVPSFARQTGLPCSGCHSGGFYPELNAFGRFFKLHGYLMSAHADEPYEPYPPLAAAQMWSYTYTNRGQPGLSKEPTLTYASEGNDNFSYPQQANFFLAGRFFGPIGGFVMGTYDGVDNNWAFDNTDIRITGTRQVGDHSLTFGMTYNNGPSVQDAWNTLPAWSQYIGSEVAPGPAGAVSMSNLISQVSGFGGFFLIDDAVYAEFTPYVSGRSGLPSFLTLGNPTEIVTSGASPYWRIVLYKNAGPHALSIGYVGLYDEVFQNGSSGPTNNFLDDGVDVQYQWDSAPNFVTFRTAFVWENQGLSTAKNAGAAEHAAEDLYTFQFWLEYYRYNLIGVTGSLFNIGGSTDHLIYAEEPVSGSRSGSPDTLGGFIQVNLIPFSRWFHQMWPALPMTQFALQYTFYGTFNGASSNYDGSGRSASDNNTLYLLAWTPW
jgi:hypothetical protein